MSGLSAAAPSESDSRSTERPPSRPVGRVAAVLSTVLPILGALHYYFWLRLVHDTALPSPWYGLATAAIVALGLGIPGSILVNVFAPRLARYVTLPFFLWFGTLLLVLTGLLGADVVMLLLRITGAADGVDPLLVRRVVIGGGAGLVAVAVGVAILNARRLVVRELSIPLPRLPQSLDGTRIVQLTDLHVGARLGRDFVEDVVARTNALDPDLVVITGDLADSDVEHVLQAIAPFAGLKARHGVFFVTGNHEYYHHADAWIAELKRLGMRVLRNERALIGSGPDSFDLAGIDDPQGRMMPGHGPDLDRALEGRDPSRALVLLAHRPRAAIDASTKGVGLVLSGHTHAGQIWPFNYFVRLDQPVVAGMARFGETTLYVGPGTGFWGPPMRLGSTREITSIRLRAPSAM